MVNALSRLNSAFMSCVKRFCLENKAKSQRLEKRAHRGPSGPFQSHVATRRPVLSVENNWHVE